MASYTKAISITFNDNDGGLSYTCNPESAEDVVKHYEKHGKLIARIMFFRMFWKGLKRLENIHQITSVKNG